VNSSATNREIERQIAELALAELDRAKEPDTFLNRVEQYASRHMRSLALGSGLGIMSIVALSIGAPVSKQNHSDDGLIVGSISRPAAERIEWRPIQKPNQLVGLESPLLSGSKASYQAFRGSGDALRDNLRFRPEQPRQADVQLSLHRNANGGEAVSLLIETIRNQAEEGRAVIKTGQPSSITSKFGAIETLDAQVSAGEDQLRACLMFRSQSHAANVRLSGWYCPGEGRVATRPELVCLLDKVTLLKSGQDTNLRQFFTQAERNRQDSCTQARQAKTTRQSWLDSHARIPEMRSGLPGNGNSSGTTSSRKQ
jgi:hypothetical protein